MGALAGELDKLADEGNEGITRANCFAVLLACTKDNRLCIMRGACVETDTSSLTIKREKFTK